MFISVLPAPRGLTRVSSSFVQISGWKVNTLDYPSTIVLRLCTIGKSLSKFYNLFEWHHAKAQSTEDKRMPPYLGNS